MNMSYLRHLKMTTVAIGSLMAVAAGLHTVPVSAAEKELRVGLVQITTQRGNAYGGVSLPHIYIWSAMYDALVAPDKTGRPRPLLAQSWQNIDPTTWRVSLKPNVKFHNGAAMNARAFVDAITFLTSEDGKKTVIGQGMGNAAVVSATAIDNMTVDFKTSRPNAILPTMLSSLPVMEPGHFADVGLEGITQEPVGTGAFRQRSWNPDGVVLEAFDDHFRGRPKLDSLRFLELSDTGARVAAMLSDQIDVDTSVAPDDIARIESGGGVVHRAPAPSAVAIALISAGQIDGKGKDTPFADRRVRQAVNYAVNKEAIANDLLGGAALPAGQASTRTAFGYNTAISPYPHDPDKARALLREAGYPDGFKIRMQALQSTPANRLSYEAAASDLSKIGIEMEIIQVNIGEFLKSFLGGTYIEEDYNAISVGFQIAPEMDATAALEKWVSCHKKPEVSIFYCNPAEADLLTKAAGEFDADKRLAILHALMKENHENAGSLYLVEPFELTAHRKEVRNYDNLNRVINYHEIDLAR